MNLERNCAFLYIKTQIISSKNSGLLSLPLPSSLQKKNPSSAYLCFVKLLCRHSTLAITECNQHVGVYKSEMNNLKKMLWILIHIEIILKLCILSNQDITYILVMYHCYSSSFIRPATWSTHHSSYIGLWFCLSNQNQNNL